MLRAKTRYRGSSTPTPPPASTGSVLLPTPPTSPRSENGADDSHLDETPAIFTPSSPEVEENPVADVQSPDVNAEADYGRAGVGNDLEPVDDVAEENHPASVDDDNDRMDVDDDYRVDEHLAFVGGEPCQHANLQDSLRELNVILRGLTDSLTHVF
ncbi:hypothetical protein FA13DRAFT_1800172 [Coprinellus micaceus]|uniref:Uncharacterized protein n=1 Tax=Coprinellus micaceus TaxID=71717 RepID=A0A4Y7SHX9_COPMI|nr:hypothetical protein FA13DRAFT_1800172 [Coprinellus micaceus]